MCLTLNEVLDCFSYDADSGVLSRIRHRRRPCEPRPVGTVNSAGYMVVRFNNANHLVHRICYLIHHGNLPEFVDHADGNCLNNAATNLRAADKYQNAQNTVSGIKNTSGLKGAYYCKRDKVWRACIKFNGQRKYLGQFSTREEAAAAYAKASATYHGDFGNLEVQH